VVQLLEGFFRLEARSCLVGQKQCRAVAETPIISKPRPSSSLETDLWAQPESEIIIVGLVILLRIALFVRCHKLSKPKSFYYLSYPLYRRFRCLRQ